MGCPGDHFGISLSITCPGVTDIGAGAWRLSLDLLDDAAFCDIMQTRVHALQAAHLITPACSRGQRLEGLLKRSPS